MPLEIILSSHGGSLLSQNLSGDLIEHGIDLEMSSVGSRESVFVHVIHHVSSLGGRLCPP